MQFKNFAQVNQELLKHAANSYTEKYTLDRMVELMALLGNPQNEVPVIHVAGTAGKTSTCYYIAQQLQAAGKKVGLTVSPHIDEVNERVQINLEPLDEARFCQYLNEFLEIDGLLALRPSYFELLVAFAYWVFAREQVDYAVVEVGLGGLLDGTNVVSDTNKLCVITDIGLDHTQVLGDTKPAIAAQKAGIIQPSNHVFMLEQAEEVTDVIRRAAESKDATVHIEQEQAYAQLLPTQARNWSLARAVVAFVASRDGFAVPAVENPVMVPGRFEQIQFSDKTIILDGAHNPEKFSMLAENLQSQNIQQAVFIVGLVTSKQDYIDDCLRAIAPHAAEIIFTAFGSEQDIHHISVDPTELIARADRLGLADKCCTEPTPASAVQRALQSGKSWIVACGSLYLLGFVRKQLEASK